VDLALNPPGIGVTHEAARRRQVEGTGADRSWRVGADGEFAVATLLATPTEVSRWDRWRGRAPQRFVLHAVPLGDGQGQVRGDVDHLLIGPPGVVSINAKHHRTGKLVLDGDQLVLNGHRTDYVPKARREAHRVTDFLQTALAVHGPADLAGRVPVRPLLVIVGGRLVTTHWPAGVTVVMTSTLIEAITAFPAALDRKQVAAVYELARRSTTWNPAPSHSAAYLPTPPTATFGEGDLRPSDAEDETPGSPRPGRS
jgi:Nuclease-related domain